eukprot:CAMPEP_0171234314 /NCGR_PEP_ID=MMETSP0790-20130122/41369_1 /TAXON_ID=2925 /ORGANISM="Alexandrium catenella, Strain OF101" /LENGTH=57 /DNA_ID=CAMNT_0011700595 /DNA_START=123 /DNA_END=293 /DNA_ORIENTATION=-
MCFAGQVPAWSRQAKTGWVWIPCGGIAAVPLACLMPTHPIPKEDRIGICSAGGNELS